MSNKSIQEPEENIFNFRFKVAFFGKNVSKHPAVS